MQPGIGSVIRAGLVASLLSGLLAAQSSNGVLTGTIFDQAGARLGRALVTVRNADTGVGHSVQPNERGDYRFENLPPGKYSVRASAIGLTAVQINDVSVEANEAAAVNVRLPIAAVTPISVVEVSEAPLSINLPGPPVTPAAKNEIGGLRDRLALSAAQLIRLQVIFEDRNAQIDQVRGDATLPIRARREKIRSIREEAEGRFRAVLNENQTDEYDEILRERRERALRKQETALQASH